LSMCSAISSMAAVGWTWREVRKSIEIATGLWYVLESFSFSLLISFQIEFKSLPESAPTAVSPGHDPRTSTTLIVFEEFVPLEYRQQLAESRGTKSRLPFFLSPPKSKEWKQASTLNGRPYVVGSVPPPPHFREVEFEGILRGDSSSTRIIRMDSKSVKLSPATSLPVS
jgi:hypothetical protein